ncbi:MAG TPA: HDOD domain-containing protein [Spongiibacteraceae bacterium]|nr:HDOD domain-containing protein [Spongiibacteraceae bacterium]
MFRKLTEKLIRNRANKREATKADSLTPDNAKTLAAAQHAAAVIAPRFRRAVFDCVTGTADSVPERLIAQTITQQMRDASLRRNTVPRLPAVIPVLLQQLRDPNASARDYVAVIRQDPVVATAVLKIANSAYFNPYRKKMEHFEQAVVTLGIEGLRLVLSTAVMLPIVRGQNNKLPQRVWDHSLACAVCCQQLAQRAHLDPFKAYLLGLVHDVGVVTLFNQLQLRCTEFLGAQAPSPGLLVQLVDELAQPLAYWIAQDWQLPVEIVRALAAQAEAPSVKEPALSKILRLANSISEAYSLARMDLIEREELEGLLRELACPDNLLQQLNDVFSEAVTPTSCQI